MLPFTAKALLIWEHTRRLSVCAVLAPRGRRCRPRRCSRELWCSPCLGDPLSFPSGLSTDCELVWRKDRADGSSDSFSSLQASIPR